MSVSVKMTAIADETRELTGVTGKLGLDAIATNLGDANDEVSDQASIIAQCMAALEGKAIGGGSSSGSIETFKIKVVNNSSYSNEDLYTLELWTTYINKRGRVESGIDIVWLADGEDEPYYEPVKGTSILVYTGGTLSVSVSGDGMTSMSLGDRELVYCSSSHLDRYDHPDLVTITLS